MVYLTMTPMIVEALRRFQSLEGSEAQSKPRIFQDKPKESSGGEEDKYTLEARTRREEMTIDDRASGEETIQRIPREEAEMDTARYLNEPSLSNPKIGNPISHSQVIDLSRQLKAQGSSPRSLDALLRGSRVYVAPPPPKPELTSEYKALMARLRREEEARSYERMINPPPVETFAQRFPLSSAAYAFPSYQEPEPEDEVTYADINRQMAMIANVLLSIVACAGAIWIAARWWSTPARLALSMSGSLLVGVAEVVVYSGYVRRVSEAKGKEKGVQEIREIMKTWVVGGGKELLEEESREKSVPIEGKQDPDDVKARRRKKDMS